MIRIREAAPTWVVAGRFKSQVLPLHRTGVVHNLTYNTICRRCLYRASPFFDGTLRHPWAISAMSNQILDLEDMHH